MINKIDLNEYEKKYIYALADNDENTTDEKNILIDGTKYYFKSADHSYTHVEFIVEKLAKMVGINCVHYDYAVINNRPFYLSKDLEQDGKFFSGGWSDLIYPTPMTLFDCKKKFESYNFNNINQLMDQLIDVYMFDIILGIADRHYANFGVIKNNETEQLYILDNSFAFADYQCSHFLYNLEKRNKNFINSYIDDLNIFFDQANIKYFERFKNMLEMLTPENIEKVINEIEDELNENNIHKDRMVDYVKNVRLEIDKMVSNNIKNIDFIDNDITNSTLINENNYLINDYDSSKVIMERLAYNIYLDSEHYIVCNSNDKLFCLTESNQTDIKYASEFGISLKDNNLLDIIQVISDKFPDKINDLTNDIIKAYILNIFMGLNYNTGVDFYFKIANNDVKIVIYDNKLHNAEERLNDLKDFLMTTDFDIMNYYRQIISKLESSNIEGLNRYYGLLLEDNNNYEMQNNIQFYKDNISKIYDIFKKEEDENEHRIHSSK